MKSQALLNELTSVLDATSQCQKRHRETLKFFLMQFKAEEEKLVKKLKNATDENSRDKWERKLGLVREAYEILEA